MQQLDFSPRRATHVPATPARLQNLCDAYAKVIVSLTAARRQGDEAAAERYVADAVALIDAITAWTNSPEGAAYIAACRPAVA